MKENIKKKIFSSFICPHFMGMQNYPREQPAGKSSKCALKANFETIFLGEVLTCAQLFDFSLKSYLAMW